MKHFVYKRHYNSKKRNLKKKLDNRIQIALTFESDNKNLQYCMQYISPMKIEEEDCKKMVKIF